MKRLRIVGVFLFSCVAIIQLTSAGKASSRKIRNGFQWYLDQIVDSAGFFALDTLRFVDPEPGLIQTTTFTNGVSDRDVNMDTLNIYPHLAFYGKPKDEFSINYNCHEIKTTSGMKAWGCRSQMTGRFNYKRKTQIITFDFYKVNDTMQSDNLDEQIKYSTKKYRVLEFSKSNLVLVKMAK